MRNIVVAAVVLVAVAIVAIGGVGWYFSQQVLVPAPYQLFPEFEVVAVEPLDDGAYEVTLPLPDEDPAQFARTSVEGRYGLVWDAGAGELSDVLRRQAGAVVRRLELSRGTPPAEGTPARMDVTLFAEPADLGIDAQEVRVPGPVGDLPAWWIPGRAEDAVLVLHGRRRADRSEALRALPTLVEDGASVLVVSYRNHDASPPSPDGLYHYGGSEADDALAAVAWLEQRGVERIALMGFSMGGAVATLALQRWPDDASAEPVGLILDSPLVAPEPIFAEGARRAGLPAADFLAAVTTRMASWRTGVDFARLDLREIAPEVDVPTLLIAGGADSTVPIETVDVLAARLPQRIGYLRLDDVEHVEGWNAESERYETALRDFLTLVFDLAEVASAPAPAGA